VLGDFLNQHVKLVLRLNQRFQNSRSGKLGWPVEVLFEVENSLQAILLSKLLHGHSLKK
jgi:hypothetical protein